MFEFIRQRDTSAQFIAGGLEQKEPAKKGCSYVNQFWLTNNEHGAFSAIGIHGQNVYVDPTAKMVIAKNSSHTEAEGDLLEQDFFFAAHALSKYLIDVKKAKL